MPEIRKDPVIERWVIIAQDRERRPQHEIRVQRPKRTGACPFCAGNEASTPPEVFAYRQDGTPPDGPGWAVRVVPNKYPALADAGGHGRFTATFFDSMGGVGRHEVVIECPEHLENIGMLDESQLVKILRAYRHRMSALGQDERWRSILIYQNHGPLAGATLPHFHSQLIALPMTPPALREKFAGAKNYYDANGRCVYCDIIEREIEQRQRIVLAEERFIVLCPYASRFPFETWILPAEHKALFEQSSDDDFAQLAGALRSFLISLNRARHDPPFNYIIHSSPSDDSERRHYHWHIEILPRLTQAAGFEWGSGSYINPMAPEEAARLLRAAWP